LFGGGSGLCGIDEDALSVVAGEFEGFISKGEFSNDGDGGF
jgi:hypothetical protein